MTRRRRRRSLRRPPAPVVSPPPLALVTAFFLPAPRPTVSAFLVMLAPAGPLATAVVRPSPPPSTPDRLTVFCCFPPCFQRMLRQCPRSYSRSPSIPFLIIGEVNIIALRSLCFQVSSLQACVQRQVASQSSVCSCAFALIKPCLSSNRTAVFFVVVEGYGLGATPVGGMIWSG